MANSLPFLPEGVAHEGEHIVIYADGSCRGNPGPGGFAARLRRMNGATVVQRGTVKGHELSTTNNRMELRAVIHALARVEKYEHLPIFVVCDSKYVIDGMRDWLAGWKANGWRTASKQPVKNVELWRELDSICEGKNIQWHWVKAHVGHVYNEEVDKLAREEAEKASSAVTNGG